MRKNVQPTPPLSLLMFLWLMLALAGLLGLVACGGSSSSTAPSTGGSGEVAEEEAVVAAVGAAVREAARHARSRRPRLEEAPAAQGWELRFRTRISGCI